jgi:hypothetical protein
VKENMFKGTEIPDQYVHLMKDWQIVGPIRGLGKYTKKFHRYLDQHYPPFNTEDGQEIPQYQIAHFVEYTDPRYPEQGAQQLLLTSEGFRRFIYLESYKEFLEGLHWPAVLLSLLAEEVYEWEPRDVESGTDPMIQQGSRTHLQDIGVRYAIEQLNLIWQGDQGAVCINERDIEGNEGDYIPENTDPLIEYAYAEESTAVREWLKEIARLVQGNQWWSLLNPTQVPAVEHVEAVESNQFEVPFNQKVNMREFGDDWYEHDGEPRNIESLFQKSRYLLLSKLSPNADAQPRE